MSGQGTCTSARLATSMKLEKKFIDYVRTEDLHEGAAGDLLAALLSPLGARGLARLDVHLLPLVVPLTGPLDCLAPALPFADSP